MTLTQLPSKYLKERGVHKVQYKVSCEYPYTFTEIPNLHENALDCVGILSDDKRTITWVEDTIGRANKYTKSELEYIFKDLIYIK